MAIHGPGPFRMIATAEGERAPFYIMPFDSRGRCAGPKTRESLLEAARGGEFSDVLVFAHGWNNDWNTAMGRYEDFVKGFTSMRKSNHLKFERGYRPLLVGVFWPSTSLVLPWERAPRFAGDGALEPEVGDAFTADETLSVQSLASELPEDQVARFYELAAGTSSLSRDQAVELAGMLLPLLGTGDELWEADGVSANELVDAWFASTPGRENGDTGFGEYVAVNAAASQPESAGLLTSLDPRHALRMATVWRMKDRAGTVGAHGVGPLLGDLLRATSAAVHLVGHSYGCKVVLSALCHSQAQRKVRSVLLLQPAISHLCFAEDVGDGRAGGYRAALDLSEQPILTTFSCHDVALTKVFHLAVRRKSDIGEHCIAGTEPPNRYAALGGFGPRGCGKAAVTVSIHDVGQAYEELARADVRVVALDGARTISGHGDINHPSAWWILYEQMRAG